MEENPINNIYPSVRFDTKDDQTVATFYVNAITGTLATEALDTIVKTHEFDYYVKIVEAWVSSENDKKKECLMVIARTNQGEVKRITYEIIRENPEDDSSKILKFKPLDEEYHEVCVAKVKDQLEKKGNLVTYTHVTGDISPEYIGNNVVLPECSIEDLRSLVLADLRSESKDGKVTHYEIVTENTPEFQIARFIHLLWRKNEDTILCIMPKGEEEKYLPISELDPRPLEQSLLSPVGLRDDAVLFIREAVKILYDRHREN